MTVGGGELVTSQTMLAVSPSVNSWGEGAFVKVIFSVKKIINMHKNSLKQLGLSQHNNCCLDSCTLAALIFSCQRTRSNSDRDSNRQ